MAVIKTITPTNQSQTASLHRLGYNSPSVLFALGALFFALLVAVPVVRSLYAYSHIAFHQTTLDALEDGRSLGNVTEVLRDYQLAAAWSQDSRLKVAIGQLQLALARQVQSSDAWENAVFALQDTVATRPLDSLAWGRLAYALLQGVKGQTAERQGDARVALSQSFTTGTYAASFLLWRYTLALPLWAQMDEAQKAQMAAQTGLLWQGRPWKLMRLARLAPFASTIESIMKANYPEEMHEFYRKRGRLRFAAPTLTK